MQPPTVDEVVAQLGLAPLPVEGGLYRQVWRSAILDAAGRPAGTAILLLLTDDPDSFSAMHRLGTDELWHFYLGDPVSLLELRTGGISEVTVLGPDLRAGQTVVRNVPAGTWMGASRLGGGFGWSLLGTTMAPGFDATEFDASEAGPLIRGWPQEADRIGRLVRPGTGDHRLPAGFE
ncbi:MAG: cupin domain-containing protein [Acidimicrobiales bacterium]